MRSCISFAIGRGPARGDIPNCQSDVEGIIRRVRVATKEVSAQRRSALGPPPHRQRRPDLAAGELEGSARAIGGSTTWGGD
eukprot:9354993-Pyramimonas_sp.AAC.1